MINTKLVRTRLAIMIETVFKPLSAEDKQNMGAPYARGKRCGADVTWQILVAIIRKIEERENFDSGRALAYAASTVRAFKRFMRKVNLRGDNFEKVVVPLHHYLSLHDQTYRLEHIKFNIYSQLKDEHKFYMVKNLEPCSTLISSDMFHSLSPSAVPMLSDKQFNARMSIIRDGSYRQSYGIPLVWCEIELTPVTTTAEKENLICCLAQIGNHEFKVIAEYIKKASRNKNDPTTTPLSGYARLQDLDTNSNIHNPRQLKMVLGCKDIDFVFHPPEGFCKNGG